MLIAVLLAPIEDTLVHATYSQLLDEALSSG